MCIVPLIARGRVLGDLALATGDESGRRFGPETLDASRGRSPTASRSRWTTRCSTSTASTSRSRCRRSCCRASCPRCPGIDVAARYAAAGEGNDVGGDFYDLFASGDGWQVVIGDVVGKGPAAAAVTGLARHTIRAAAPYEASPSALLRVLNRARPQRGARPAAWPPCAACGWTRRTAGWG